MVTKRQILTAVAFGFGLVAVTSGPSPRPMAAAQPSAKSLDAKDAKKADAENDKMFPDGRDFNFGKVAHGTRVKHAFRIVNTSKVPLRINSVRVSMSPMMVWATKTVLQPNEEAKLETVVDTRPFYGLRSMRVYVTTEHGKTIQEFRFFITCFSEERP